MRKKWLCLQLMFVLLNVWSCKVTAQDIQFEQPTANGIKEVSNQHYLKPTALIIPGTLLLYGALKPAVRGISNLDNDILEHIKKSQPGFHTNAEEYLMWEPSASLYIMDAFKQRTKSSFKEHLFLDAGSIIVTGGIGYLMRKISGNIKEYNRQGTKFPSGHTANAFRGAEILHQELKYKYKLFSYSGYVAAVAVGILRIYNKDHLLTEVLAGAGLGIISTKLTYWIFDKVKFQKR